MKYPKFTMEYSFVRATVNSWIKKCKDGENRGIKNVGKSNLVDTSLLKKVKNIPLGTRLFGSVINKHQLISICNRHSYSKQLLKNFGGDIVLNETNANVRLEKLILHLSFQRKKSSVSRETCQHWSLSTIFFRVWL